MLLKLLLQNCMEVENMGCLVYCIFRVIQITTVSFVRVKMLKWNKKVWRTGMSELQHYYWLGVLGLTGRAFILKISSLFQPWSCRS